MARYHINPETGNIGVCSAKIQCDFELSNDEHYSNKSAALEASEKQLEQKHSTIEPSMKKYSFIKEFKLQEQRFEEDFDGIPTRFFNADLRKRNLMIRPNVEITLDNLEEVDLKSEAHADSRKFVSGMFQALSSPTDAAISDDELRAVGERLGLDLKKIEDERFLRALGVSEAWVHTEDHINKIGKTVQMAYVVSPDKKIGQSMARYGVKFNPPEGLPRSFRTIETRNLVGADRLLKKTGENLIQTFGKKYQTNWGISFDEDERRQMFNALLQLEEAQLEGRSFKAQQKYVKENSSSNSARAWEDKKNPKESHVEAGKKSVLMKHFRKIEIDDDVDLDEFKRFEKDFVEVVDKLPKIPKGKEPELKIRKLGRHKAHGIYFPHKNVIGIDIRTSGSTVHELAHQYDLTIKGNASLRREFRDVVSDYTKSLKIPPGEPSSRAEYLSTPTEILARGFTVFAHEELGIKNSLIDERKFDNYDHTPFKNPELKEKMFNFIRSLYKED